MKRRRRRHISQLEFPPELASGARIGGKFVGPYSGTMAIWKGRPPILTTGDDLEPGALVISCQGGKVGSSVTIEFNGKNSILVGRMMSSTNQISISIMPMIQLDLIRPKRLRKCRS